MTQLICVASWGNHGLVAAPDQTILPVQYQRRVGRPLCGDRVDIDLQPDSQWLATHIHPRSNCFARADRRGRRQQIAANLDQIVVVLAPEPAPSRDLIDRYLAAGEILGIACLLVLNKVDLDESALEALRERLNPYRQLGYRVLECSAETGHGLDQLAPELSGRQSLLAGQSGVGKSSLLNRLIPDLSVQTNSLSSATGKGKHTTTIAKLYFLEHSAGCIIDSPGVWEYGLWQMDSAELAHGFIEFRELLGTCRFQDCQHRAEPGCALLARAESDAVFAHRLACYQRLLREQQRFDQPTNY